MTVFFCDVDGVLLRNGRINSDVKAFLEQRQAEGHEVLIWSARGREHARKVCEMAELECECVPKPQAILDDRGWEWVKWVPVLRDIGA
jgi:ribonucleotide monophosphatase NagD (HAD superfamily)